MLLHLRLFIPLRWVLQSHEWAPDLIEYLSPVENGQFYAIIVSISNNCILDTFCLISTWNANQSPTHPYSIDDFIWLKHMFDQLKWTVSSVTLDVHHDKGHVLNVIPPAVNLCTELYGVFAQHPLWMEDILWLELTAGSNNLPCKVKKVQPLKCMFYLCPTQLLLSHCKKIK